jgi:hypothetical protein
VKKDVLILAICLHPLFIFSMVVGIFLHVWYFTENQLIEKRLGNLAPTNGIIDKYIIREHVVTHSNSSKAGSRSGGPDYTYNAFVAVHYEINSKVFRCFGKSAADDKLSDALMRFNHTSCSAPLFYQQTSSKKTFQAEKYYEVFKNFVINKPTENKPFSVKYLPENPQITNLNTVWKNPTPIVFVFYGAGLFFLLFYLILCHISRAGNTAYTPVLISTGILIAFLIIRLLTFKPTIDRVPLSEPAFEIQLGQPDTQAKLSHYLLENRNEHD